MNLCLRYEGVALLSFTEPVRWNDRIFLYYHWAMLFLD